MTDTPKKPRGRPRTRPPVDKTPLTWRDFAPQDTGVALPPATTEAALDLRALDALVAYEIMGWAKKTTECNREQVVLVPADWTDLSARRWLGHDVNELVPHYTTSWDAAGQVVERLQLAVIPDASGGWRSGQAPFYGPGWYEENVHDWEWADTAPLAICLAALEYLGVEVDQPASAQSPEQGE